MKQFVPILLLMATPAWAQDAPDSIAQDTRFKTFDFAAGGLFHLPTSPEVIQTVLFAQGEHIQSVIVSDPHAYVITVSGMTDSLTLRPNGPSSLAAMSVRTNLRNYEIELTPGGVSLAPNVVRFSYSGLDQSPSQPQSTAPIAMPEGVSYRLSGDKLLRPASISDDGTKTYIAWQDDQAMPAIFAIGASGKEEMVDGYVRGGTFTIDRVYRQLIFRIDRQSAKAKREIKRGRHE